MDFLLGMAAGALLWPWWGLGILVVLFLIDAVLVENDNAGWGTFIILVGTALLVWLAGGMNPFTLAWDNLGSLINFFILYFIVGGIWSIAKWYFYLLKVRDDMRERGTKERPTRSYAKNNKSRILGWIGHWPFSVIGTLFGDFLTRIVKTIYEALSSVYDRIANSVFAEFKQ